MRTILYYLPAVLIFTSTVSFSQAGSLDPTFGTGGKAIEPHAPAQEMIIQPDDKIVITGNYPATVNQFFVARYLPDGTLDTSFDTDGMVTTDAGMTSEGARNLLLQTDGKIVAVGSAFINSHWGTTLVRYNTDGSLDATFDDDGIAQVDIGSSYIDPESIAIQQDGKIVVAFSANDGIGYDDFFVLRLLPDGSPDSTFDSDGIVSTDFIGNSDNVNAMRIQADGKIVVAGSVTDDWSDFAYALARYNTDGSLDNTFGTGGKVFTPPTAEFSVINAMVVTSSGKIITVGTRQTTGTYADFFARVYNPDGSLDMTYGISGMVTYDYLLDANFTTDVEIQSDGKIVFSGRNLNTTYGFFIAVRLNADGTLDTSFSTDGIAIAKAGELTIDIATCIGVQSNGKIVLGGSMFDGSYKSMLVRLMGESFTGLEKQTGTSDVMLFPNPTATGDFTVSFPQHLTNATVVVTDLNGRIILQQDGLNGNNLSFSISDQPAGIYLVEIQNSEEIYRSKAVKH